MPLTEILQVLGYLFQAIAGRDAEIARLRAENARLVEAGMPRDPEK